MKKKKGGGRPSDTVDDNANYYNQYGKQWEGPSKENKSWTTYDPAIPPTGYTAKGNENGVREIHTATPSTELDTTTKIQDPHKCP